MAELENNQTAKKSARKKVAAKAPAKKRVRKTPSVAKRDGTHGGARKGSGRKKGATTKKTREIADKLAEDGGQTPLEYMLEVLRTDATKLKERFESGDIDETQYAILFKQLTERRDWAAQQAAPFIHPRLSAVQADVKLTGHDLFVSLMAEEEG